MHLGAYGQAYFAAETMEIVSGKGHCCRTEQQQLQHACQVQHNLKWITGWPHCSVQIVLLRTTPPATVFLCCTGPCCAV
jgi:hypothetical protein